MQVVRILARRTVRTTEQELLGWEVNQKGRLLWLQKLAMRVLRSYGQQATVPVASVETIRVPVDYDSVIKAAQDQITELRAMNRKPKCICLGQDFVHKWRDEFLQKNMADFDASRLDFTFGNHIQRTFAEPSGRVTPTEDSMLGISLVIIPNFNGLVVVPEA